MRSSLRGLPIHPSLKQTAHLTPGSRCTNPSPVFHNRLNIVQCPRESFCGDMAVAWRKLGLSGSYLNHGADRKTMCFAIHWVPHAPDRSPSKLRGRAVPLTQVVVRAAPPCGRRLACERIISTVAILDDRAAKLRSLFGFSCRRALKSPGRELNSFANDGWGRRFHRTVAYQRSPALRIAMLA